MLVERNLLSELVDLDTLIPLTSGVTITDAVAISDSGVIFCSATVKNGTAAHPVLLIPIEQTV